MFTIASWISVVHFLLNGLFCFHNIWFLLQLVLFMTKLYYSANIPNKLFWSFCMQIPNTLGSHGNTLSLSDSTNFACSKYHHPPSPFQRKQLKAIATAQIWKIKTVTCIFVASHEKQYLFTDFVGKLCSHFSDEETHALMHLTIFSFSEKAR